MVQEFDNEGKLAKNPAQNTSNWQTFELLNSTRGEEASVSIGSLSFQIDG